MINMLRVTYFVAAALGLFAASIVTVSMLIPERAPNSSQFWIVTIGVGLFLAVVGLVLLGIGRHLPAIGVLAQSITNDDSAQLKSRWRRLAVHMLLGGLLLVPVLLLIAWGILARIVEGFALFGEAAIDRRARQAAQHDCVGDFHQQGQLAICRPDGT